MRILLRTACVRPVWGGGEAQRRGAEVVPRRCRGRGVCSACPGGAPARRAHLSELMTDLPHSDYYCDCCYDLCYCCCCQEGGRRAGVGRGRGARLVELMTDLPHSRELSALGSLRAADGVDPVRLQRGEVDWGSEAAGDPLRWLLRRHFRGRLVVSPHGSARKVWGVRSGRFGFCLLSFLIFISMNTRANTRTPRNGVPYLRDPHKNTSQNENTPSTTRSRYRRMRRSRRSMSERAPLDKRARAPR